MNIPQTSASDRLEAARKALAQYEKNVDGVPAWELPYEISDVAEALRALIAPPSVGQSEADMVQTAIQNAPAHVSSKGILFQYDDLIAMVTAAIHASIQSAHETWEPEAAMQPSQEQMLRWLKIEHDGHLGEETIFIYQQHIEREEI